MARWFDWVLDQFGLRKKQPKPVVQPVPVPVPPPPPPPVPVVPEPIPQPVPVPVPESSTLRIFVDGAPQELTYPWRIEYDRGLWLIFWGGNIHDPAPKHQGPYRVELNGELHEISRHDWGACVTLGTPPPARRTVSELIAAKLIPAFSSGPVNGRAVPPAPPSNLRAGNMGEAGDDDGTIGLFNEWDAAFIAGLDQESMHYVANSAHAIPCHLTDKGEPVDFLNKYPLARTLDEQWKVWPESARLTIFQTQDARFHIDGGTLSHLPNVAYLRALLYNRRDDRLTVQNIANYCAAFAAERWLNPYDIQTRGLAWTLAAICRAYLIAPDNPEPGFLPKSYWRQWLTVIADGFRKNSIDPAVNPKAHFRSTHPLAMVTWQEEYLGTVLCWAVVAGIEELREMATWIMEGIVARTSGNTAWPKEIFAVRDGYAMIWAKRKDNGAFIDVRRPENGAWPEFIPAKDWDELWAWNGANLSVPTISAHYSSYVRMGLIFAKQANLQIDGLAEAYANVVPRVIPQARRHAVGVVI